MNLVWSGHQGCSYIFNYFPMQFNGDELSHLAYLWRKWWLRWPSYFDKRLQLSTINRPAGPKLRDATPELRASTRKQRPSLHFTSAPQTGTKCSARCVIFMTRYAYWPSTVLLLKTQWRLYELCFWMSSHSAFFHEMHKTEYEPVWMFHFK
jgi:hypothetical protein